jgi:hypothetical protein
MGNPELSKAQLVAAMRGLTDVERASVYAESIPQPVPVSLDDLRTMSPQEIVDARQAGQLDHLPAEQAARKAALRDERAAASAAAVREAERLRAQRRAQHSLGPDPKPAG